MESLAACCEECQNKAACSAYTWVEASKTCFFKEATGWERRPTKGMQSGVLVDPEAGALARGGATLLLSAPAQRAEPTPHCPCPPPLPMPQARRPRPPPR